MTLRRIGPILVLATLAGLLGAAGRVAPCEPDGRDFCDFERPEDVTFLPGTDWFVVSSATAVAPLAFVDARSRARRPVLLPFAVADTGRPARRAAPGATGCAGPPTSWRAGGHDVKRIGGRLRLVVLNKAAAGGEVRDGDERIEMFDIALRGGEPQARWSGCVAIPARWSLNDVALSPDGTLYGSHQFDRPRSPAEAAATRQRWIDGQPTGHAVAWTPDAGWRPVPGTEVSFANGVAVSPDGATLAVAGTYSAALWLLDRRDGRARRVALPHTPDNLTALPGGRFLSTGHTGVPVTGVDPCRDPKSVPCGFPFSVVQIDDDGRVRTLFEHDGTRIPGASVAAPFRDRLYLGSFFGDRVSVVDLPSARAAR